MFAKIIAQGREELLAEHNIVDLFSRNFVLSVLTGIIGDSKMGKFLKSRRERHFYAIFSAMFNELLEKQTTNASNFSNKDEVFNELIRLSDREESCFSYFMDRSKRTRSIAYIILNESESRKIYDDFATDTIVSVARSVADSLAEQSGKLSLTCYYDFAGDSGLIQFRVRRSQQFKSYDTRQIIDLFSIANGGGHEGAIGFRFPRTEIPDIESFALNLVNGIEADIEKHLAEQT